MTYRVEFTEIDTLSAEIETRCDDMLERLEDIKTAVNGLIDNPDLQGQYAIALKSYWAPTTGVYGIIINAFKDIITAHRDNFMLYKAQYKNIMYNEDGETNPEDNQMRSIQEMRVYKPIVAVLISSFIAVIFSGCYEDTSFLLPEDTVPSELTEVIIPQLLLDYCGITAEDQLIAFGESIDRSERAEQVIVNSDGSLSYFCTDRQISNNIRRDASFLQEETERINSIFADYLVINDNYTEMIIRVNDFETYNSIFNILPLGCICGYIQIFSHPENPEWQLRITIINTNTDIVGCECTIPDEVFYLECQQFFEDTNDIETYNSDESAHNVIITTGDLSTVSTTPSVDISTYETWMPDEDLTEILLPSSLLSVAGTNASQMISSFYDPNTSTPFFAEGALSNEDESVSFYCTQGEIEETLDNLESYIQNRVNSANGNLVDSIEISEDYSEITIEVSDVQSFEDMFSLHDVWVYCAAQQLFSHPDDPEWHLHLIMVNSQTGLIGYECTLPDENLNINSIDFFNDSSNSN